MELELRRKKWNTQVHLSEVSELHNDILITQTKIIEIITSNLLLCHDIIY